MTTRHSMDLLGEALKAYYNGDRAPFYLEDNAGGIFRLPLSRHFRKADQLSGLEKRLIAMAYGDILDIGCGTGHYIPLLAQRGRALGIDVSPNIIEVARMIGCKSCRVADIFSFPTRRKFDTITLMGNNIGMGGTVSKTRRLLKKLSALLKDDGQILAVARMVSDRDFVALEIRPVWKDRTGPKFGWIHFNIGFFAGLGKQAGLHVNIVRGNQHRSLLRMVKRGG